MEPKWVLTSGQKKIRFRNLLKKRKSEKHNTNTNRQDSESETPSITVSNDSASDQQTEERSQGEVPKRHFRSFSDDTQETKNKIQTVPTIPRERNGNKPPNDATTRMGGK